MAPQRDRTDGGFEEVAAKLGVHPESVRNWLKTRQVDAGERPGVTTDERKRIAGIRAGKPRVAPGQRNPQVGLGFLRGGARPPTEQVVAYVEAHKASFGVEPICEVLEVAPSTYYAAR